jgi:hypothetical protein
MEWKFHVGFANNRHKMILESLDGLLGVVMAVIVWWDELICHDVGLDGVLELVGTFVVKDVMLGCNCGDVQAADELLKFPNHFTG